MAEGALRTEDRFKNRGCNDPVFAIFFLLQLFAAVGWVGYSYNQGKYHAVAAQVNDKAGELGNPNAQQTHALVDFGPSQTLHLLRYPQERAPTMANDDAVLHLGVLVIFGIFMALVVAVVWMALLQFYPTTMVWVSLISMPVVFGTLGIISFMYGNTLGGIVCLVSAAFFAFYIYMVQGRIEWTGKLFKSVSIVFAKGKTIFAIAFLTVILQAVWQIAWLLAAIPFFHTESHRVASSNGDVSQTDGKPSAGLGTIFILLLSLYWGSQVLVNTLHVICCGVVSRWYFSHETDSAVSKSSAAATTFLFGSICFGSLLIAIIQVLKRMAEMMRDGDRDNIVMVIIGCIAVCILGCIESLLRFFNTYALAIVSIYSVTFIRAGKEVLNLLGDGRLDMLTNYNLANIVSFFGVLAGGGAVAGTNCLLAWRLGLPVPFIAAAGFLGFLTGISVMGPVTRMTESGVEGLFICFAMEPEALQPGSEIYEVFNERKPFARR